MPITVVDLNDPIDRKKLVLRIESDVNAFCIKEFSEGHRSHLGASVIGDDCLAKAWNSFRWLKTEQHSGQQFRLFNRGHEEEHRFVRWLRGAGFELREFDPETNKQFRIVGCKGHFGGSLDGLCMAPASYDLPEALIILTEFKTHNTKNFAKLKKDGVVRSKPMHYKQMCSYGRGYELKFGLYVAVNKDTDELHFEIVPLDWLQADDMFRKAEHIIFRQTQPAKISQTPTFFDCKYCHFTGICHMGEVPEKNCRSCARAIPVDNAEWWCELHSPEANAAIPKDVIPKGCDSWTRIV